MAKLNKPKSRVRAEKVRVVVHIPERGSTCTEPPGYTSHQGGQFEDSGYGTGRGLFGFQQD